jgi:mannosylglycerate hydrolase MGH1-like protein
MNAERERLSVEADRTQNWKRWGPYLAERQWATVREDYSENGASWDHFTHDQARSRAYRWGEDGLFGLSDRECRLCFALALWNGRDPILKERLFGLTALEGNHGEDVKEQYFYLAGTPTHSYMKALYKYPQGEFPYARLVEENRARNKEQTEFELLDTGVFDEQRYFDVFMEYAKNSPNDILIKITVANRGPQCADLRLLPTLWFRNTWSWALPGQVAELRPELRLGEAGSSVVASHPGLGPFELALGVAPDGSQPGVLFTENETNAGRLWGEPGSGFFKDAFHEYVQQGRTQAVNAQARGSKSAALYQLRIPAGESVSVLLRLSSAEERPATPFGPEFEQVFEQRIREADEFYAELYPRAVSLPALDVMRQAYAGLLWSKQFYQYVVDDWLKGDNPVPSAHPESPARALGRNHEWRHVYCNDVLSVPDKWEFPWFAAWDLAFHMLPFAHLDSSFGKQQLILLLREWYMHPNGQIPAYEFEFGDVNPPVHAWAAWRVYKISGGRGQRDRDFLERVFQKLLVNFTWWVNRKDAQGKNLFSGGFLGLDNIGVFDRSRPLPDGGTLDQADATAWMAFYCLTMLNIAFELADDGGRIHPAYEDMASKFLEHFVQIADAMNKLGGTGLWDDLDGFYYDQLRANEGSLPLRVRSVVGLLPLIAVEVLEEEQIARMPGFAKRLDWFVKHRSDLSQCITHCARQRGRLLLAIPSRERLLCLLRRMLDEQEFLSPHGIRSLSKFHQDHPYEVSVGGEKHRVSYVPGESNSSMFGGNSNWRGPVWFPINYLIIEALERYHHFYGSSLQVECPTGSGRLMDMKEVARELARRLSSLFLPDAQGRRPCHGEDPRWRTDPHFRDLVLFHEYFDGETGRGLGAAHQTGWTALITRLLQDLAPLENVENGPA